MAHDSDETINERGNRIGANTLRSVNTPLGYVIEVVQAVRYGAIWGTGSLIIGAGE